MYNYWQYCLVLQEVWPEGVTLANQMHFKFPSMVTTNLKSIVRNAGAEGIRLMQDLLMWDPQKRPTAAQVSVCVCVFSRIRLSLLPVSLPLSPFNILISKLALLWPSLLQLSVELEK